MAICGQSGVVIALAIMERLVSAVRQAVPSHMLFQRDRRKGQCWHVFVIVQGRRTFQLEILHFRDDSQGIVLTCSNLDLIDFPALLARQLAPDTLSLHGLVANRRANIQVSTSVNDEQLFADNIRRVLHHLLCQVGSEQ